MGEAVGVYGNSVDVDDPLPKRTFDCGAGLGSRRNRESKTSLSGQT